MFFDLCAKIWGGSPATEQLDTGLETNDLDDEQNGTSSSLPQGVDRRASHNMQQTAGGASNNTQQGTEGASNNIQQGTEGASNNVQQAGDSSDSSSDSSSEQQSDSRSSSERQTTSDESANQLNKTTGRKRRGEQYKDDKLKKKLTADSQLLHFAEKEVQLKEKMIERIDTMSKDHRETIAVLTNNLKTLSDTMANAFALLQQSNSFGPPSHPMSSFHGSPGFSQYSQYNQYPQPMPPTSPSSIYHQPGYMPSQQAFFQQNSMSPDNSLDD